MTTVSATLTAQKTPVPEMGAVGRDDEGYRPVPEIAAIGDLPDLREGPDREDPRHWTSRRKDRAGHDGSRCEGSEKETAVKGEKRLLCHRMPYPGQRDNSPTPVTAPNLWTRGSRFEQLEADRQHRADEK